MKEEKVDVRQLNIFQKMSLATSKIETVIKGLTVGEGKNAYKAVSDKDVNNAVKPIEAELGIYSYPVKREIRSEERETFSNKFGETTNFVIKLDTTYRFVNIDKPEEYIDITSYGYGIDSQDKAPGKAMTYADKYALLKAYKIETGDDPDKGKSQSKEEQELMFIYMANMDKLVLETETNYEELLAYFQVKSNSEMTLKQLKEAVAILETKKKKNKEEVF